MKILGIDVGGTGVKSAIVETADATLVTEWHRRATPQPATPESIAQAIKEIVDDFGYSGTVGCCFPTVVIDGVATTAGNIDKSWRGTSIESTFESATGLPFVALNDADAAGIAEMELGAGRGLRGMVITITIGTGLGSGVFFEGMLIPNIELGRMPGKDGQPIEYYAVTAPGSSSSCLGMFGASDSITSWNASIASCRRTPTFLAGAPAST